MNIKVDISATLADLTELQRTQLPYATARALTRTAQQAAEKIKNWSLPSRFTLRNTWTQRGVGWTPARKGDNPPTAIVRLDRDYMVLQELGGQKMSHKGGAIAVPIHPDLRGRRIIPPQLRPKFLLGADLGGVLRIAAYKSAGTRRRRLASFNKGFIVEKGGRRYILQRTGPGPRDVRVMYVLVPATRLLERLKMEETVTDVVRQNFTGNFADALRQAVATARR